MFQRTNPTIDEIIEELRRVLDSPEPDSPTVIKLVKMCPPVERAMLRAVNSVSSSRPFRIESVEMALRYLGLRRLRELLPEPKQQSL